MSEIPVLTMHPLEQRVAELGVCPKCHSKTLQEKFRDPNWGLWMQCARRECLHIYILPMEAA